jgi:hypothetical protein
MCGRILAAIVILAVATNAHAQRPEPNRDTAPLYFVSGQYGQPLRLAGSFAVLLPLGREQYPIRQGVLLDGGAGQGGARAAAGVGRFLEYAGLDGRVVLSRTWGSPLSASNHSTYGGVEGGLTVWYVRVSAGAARRISGPPAGSATMLTWAAAFQYPFAR